MSGEIVYILVKIEDNGLTVSVDPLGVYEDAELAMEWIERLEKLNVNPDEVIFEALEYEVDADPIGLKQMTLTYDSVSNAVDETLKGLMEKGLIDQLIGPEGEFHYELTDRGKTTMKGVAGQLIQKFLDEKKNCDL
jgi:predicted transcriptional regulator